MSSLLQHTASQPTLVGATSGAFSRLLFAEEARQVEGVLQGAVSCLYLTGQSFRGPGRAGSEHECLGPWDGHSYWWVKVGINARYKDSRT